MLNTKGNLSAPLFNSTKKQFTFNPSYALPILIHVCTKEKNMN